MTRYFVLSGVLMFAAGTAVSESVSFATVDANADGFISESEFVGWKTADGETSPAEALVKFIEIDADASGMISESEMAAAMSAHSDGADTPDSM